MYTADLTATPGAAPNLARYDLILVSESGGKDSQASLDVVAEAARDAGVLGRVVVVHADLGEAEWPGVVDLAGEHPRFYGLRYEVVARRHPDGRVETILERVAQRGMCTIAARRWCSVICTPLVDHGAPRRWSPSR